MPSMLDVIPVEVQENILSLLSDRSLYSASQVCRLWFSIAARFAKLRAEPFVLPENILTAQQEILCCTEHLWLRLMNCHSLQLQLKERLYNLIGPMPLPTARQRIGTCPSAVLGCIFYVSFNEDIEVFDGNSNFKHMMTLACDNGQIKQIVPVPKLKKILVLCNTLEVYDLPKKVSNEYTMNKIQVIPHNHRNELYRYKAISADDVFIAVQKDEFSITVFYMDNETTNDYFFRFINRTKTTHKIYQFALWKEEIIILLEIGEILWWPISSSKVINCGTFQEIRYRNPVWLTKGRIFCSTITSRVLLGLWNLEAGTSYWLIGKPTLHLARCRNFDPVIDGAPHEICSVYLLYRILICGTCDGNDVGWMCYVGYCLWDSGDEDTETGQLIMTYLSDSYFANENLTTNSNLENEFNKQPEISLKLSEDPIDDIAADFSDDSLYLLLRFKSTPAKIRCFRFFFGKTEMFRLMRKPQRQLPPYDMYS